MDKIAVVILNWNGCEMLRSFLPSVVRYSKTEGAKIYVADNGSTDASVDMLRQEFPDVHLIILKENLGFAEGYNLALQQVSAEYVVLLNSDVEVTGRKEKKELQQGIKRWLDRIESHYGVKPILYTSYKFKTRYLDDSIFNAYPYWIAHYYVDSVKYQGKWDFWQHTDVGNVPGIKEDVDLNVFNGTLEELKKLTIK